MDGAVGDEVTAHGMPFDEFERIVDTVAADLFTMRRKTPGEEDRTICPGCL